MTNYGNITKSTYQADIKRKQAFFNRCKRRFVVANSPAERQFLKSEATRICTELKQCCKVWKNNNWGSFGWITKGFTVQNFNMVKGGTRKTMNTRNSFGTRTTTSSRRTTGGRTYAKRTSWGRTNGTGTRSNASRMNYVAW